MAKTYEEILKEEKRRYAELIKNLNDRGLTSDNKEWDREIDNLASQMVGEKILEVKDLGISFKQNNLYLWAYPTTDSNRSSIVRNLRELGFKQKNRDLIKENEMPFQFFYAPYFVDKKTRESESDKILSTEERESIYGVQENFEGNAEEQILNPASYPEPDFDDFIPDEYDNEPYEMFEEIPENAKEVKPSKKIGENAEAQTNFSTRYINEELSGRKTHELFEESMALEAQDGLEATLALSKTGNIRLILSGIITEENIRELYEKHKLEDYEIDTLELGHKNADGTIKDIKFSHNALKVLSEKSRIMNMLYNGGKIEYEDYDQSFDMEEGFFNALESLRHVRMNNAFLHGFEKDGKVVGAFEKNNNIKTAVFIPSEEDRRSLREIATPDRMFNRSSVKVFVNNSLNNLDYGIMCFTNARAFDSSKESIEEYNDYLAKNIKELRSNVKSLSTLDLEYLHVNTDYAMLEKEINTALEDADREIERYRTSGLPADEIQHNVESIMRGKNILSGKLAGFRNFAENPEKVLNNIRGALNIIDDNSISAQDMAFTGSDVCYYQGGNFREAMNKLDIKSRSILMAVKENVKDYLKAYEEDRLETVPGEGELNTLREIDKVLGFADFDKKLPTYGERPVYLSTVWKVSSILGANNTALVSSAMFGVPSGELECAFTSLSKGTAGLITAISKDVKDSPYFDNVCASRILNCSAGSRIGELSMSHTSQIAQYVLSSSCNGKDFSASRYKLGKIIEKYESDPIANSEIIKNLNNFSLYSLKEPSPVVDRYAFTGNQLINSFEDTTGEGYKFARAKNEEGLAASKPYDTSDVNMLSFSWHPLKEWEENDPISYWGTLKAIDNVKDTMVNFARNYRRMGLLEGLLWIAMGAGYSMGAGAVATSKTLVRVITRAGISNNKIRIEELKDQLESIKQEEGNLRNQQLKLTLALNNFEEIRIALDKTVDTNKARIEELSKENESLLYKKTEAEKEKYIFDIALKNRDVARTRLEELKTQDKSDSPEAERERNKIQFWEKRIENNDYVKREKCASSTIAECERIISENKAEIASCMADNKRLFNEAYKNHQAKLVAEDEALKTEKNIKDTLDKGKLAQKELENRTQRVKIQENYIADYEGMKKNKLLGTLARHKSDGQNQEEAAYKFDKEFKKRFPTLSEKEKVRKPSKEKESR